MAPWRLAVKSLLFLVFVVVPAALAQISPVPAAQPPVLTTQTTIVLVPALVRTKAGAPVFTLKAEDFLLTDDGVEQRANLDDETGSEPLALVVVVETGGAGARHVDAYRQLAPSIEAVIGAVPHRVAVVEFDSEARLDQGFTPDMAVVSGALQNLDVGDRGAAILDGLRFSVDLLRNQPPSYRRAILLVSETLDHGSQEALDQALRSVSETNTAIYAFGFSSGKAAAGDELARIYRDDTPGPPGGCMAKDPDNPDRNRLGQAFDCLGLLAPPLRLAKVAAIASMAGLQRNVPESVAHLTGGEFFKFSNARNLQSDILAVSHHLPNRYLLSYHPQAPHSGYHAISLKLKQYPELVVQARTGYWAEDEASPAPER
jgi:VWFA-related protein